MMRSFYGPEAVRGEAYFGSLGEDPTSVLVISNEIASPLRGPDGADGNFASFARRIAQAVSPFGIGVYAHERLGSADEHYHPVTAEYLSLANRPETMQRQADYLQARLFDAFPNVERISFAGHSAGAVESVDLALAFKAIKSGLDVSHVMTFDAPRHRHWLTIAGVARYLLYEPYAAMLPQPPRLPEERAPATEGARRRRITETRYNAPVWTRGVQPGLEAIARSMPGTALHSVVAKHSPNNIAHWPGPTRYAERMNRLRSDMPDAEPCTAEVYGGPHSGGSRKAVIVGALATAGIIPG